MQGKLSRSAVLILILAACLTFAAKLVHPQSMTPEPKRVKQIQTALVSHGYPAGATWHETQEVCRKIADEHKWQTHFAPDARVLILLGLGNEHSDLEVLEYGSNHLDRAQRGDRQ